MTSGALAFDPTAGYSVYWNAGQTWTYADDNWINITASAAPGPPVWLSSTCLSCSEAGIYQAVIMTYDAADHYVLLFGANAGITGSSETWAFAGGRWTNLTPQSITESDSPSARSTTSMTYDSLDGYVVLYGGYYPVCNGVEFRPCQSVRLNDTWKFVGGAWTNITATANGPPSAGTPSLTYDSADGYVLLVGINLTSPSGELATWTFAHGEWQQVPTSLTVPGAYSNEVCLTLVYDAASQFVLLFGGDGTATTWSYSAGNWTQVLPAYSPIPSGLCTEATYDSADGYLIAPGTAFPRSNPNLEPDAAFWNFTVAPLPASPTIASFEVNPSTTTLGQASELRVIVGGGYLPIFYNYSYLPDGCLNGDSSNLSCTARATGSYSVEVTVEDLLGRSTVANATLTVVNSAGAQPNFGASLWILVGGAVAIVTAATIVLIRYRYKRRPPAGPVGSSIDGTRQPGSPR